MANLNQLRTLKTECRVCVINSGTLPIFGDKSNPDVSIELATFGGVSIHETDELPKYICNACFSLLKNAVAFRNSAKKADALLRQRIKRKRLASNTNVKNQSFKEEVDSQSKTNDFKSEVSESKIVFVSVKLDGSVEGDTSTIKNRTKSEEFIKEEHIVDEYDDDIVEDNEKQLVMLIVSDEKETPQANVLNCKFCDLYFKTLDEYENHRNTVDHKRNYVKSFLPKKSRKKTSASRPVDAKETVHPKDRKCEICNRMFTKLHYPRHMQTQHKIKMETSRSTTKKECTVCKKLFHPVALNRHMKTAHTDQKDLPPKVKLECPICKKLFSKDFYPLHMQRHNQGDTRNYICDQCGKKFFFKSTFYTHRLIHTNDLPHRCEYCPYRGRTKGLLRTHVRTHTGDYPYKCTQCDTRCITKSNLNAHMQRHRGPVDFICDSCSRGFYSKLDLQRHIMVVHQGIKNHICNICGLAFGYRHGLMSHQLNVHKRAKGLGKAKAVYLKLEEAGVLQTSEKESALKI